MGYLGSRFDCRKVVSLWAVLAVCGLGLAGCGGSDVNSEVKQTVTAYANAFTQGDYKTACGMLDQAGLGVLRRATNTVHIEGSCEQRLEGVAKLVGRRNLNDLAHADIRVVEHAGKRDIGFAAQAWYDDTQVTYAGIVPVVGLANTPQTGWRIQCMPFICGASLQRY